MADFMKNYSGVKIGDQNKLFAPLVRSKTSVENLRDRRNGKKSIPFAILMVFREGKDQNTDYYFCRINQKGITRKNKQNV